MIERMIYDALKAGIAEFQADPNKMERFFLKNRRLPQAEVDLIKTAFGRKAPNVFHQYPRIDQFPPDEPAAAWAIVLADEDEDDRPLGDTSGIIGLADEGGLDPSNPEAGAECFNSVWNQKLMVMTITDHADLTVYYYHLCKLFLVRARPFFKDQELLDITFRGGDLAPDPRYLPGHLFVRQLTLTTKKEERMAGSKEPRAFEVAGLHVDDGNSIEALGGVVANVTPYGAGIEEES
jgi:hypothetical protein